MPTKSPFCIWMTGLPGSGKSTLAEELKRRLDVPLAVLDGDVMRRDHHADLGFSPKDRQENIRRASGHALSLLQSGVSVVGAFITPYEVSRMYLRQQFRDFRYYEVFVDCPLEVCMDRDPKGLYTRAVAGEIADFTGVSAPYEVPESPDIRLYTGPASVLACVDEIITNLQKRGLSDVEP